MDYTFKFMDMRKKYAKHDLVNQYTDTHHKPEWVEKSEEIRKTLDIVQMKEEELEQRVKKSQDLVFKEAANQLIMSTRFEIKQNINKANNLIKAFEKFEPASKEERESQEYTTYKESIKNTFAARSTYLGALFKDQSARFMDDIVRQVNQAEEQFKQKTVTEAEKIYQQAEEEMKLILEEIQELVEMINGLVGSIYECGTILNRVEAYMTEAEQYVEKAVANLEDTKKIQKSVNKLRIVTYSIIAADYVLAILVFIL